MLRQVDITKTESEDGLWIVFDSEQDEDIYKFHLQINLDEYGKFLPQITPILMKAVSDGVINAFKHIKEVDSTKNIALLKSLESDIEDFKQIIECFKNAKQPTESAKNTFKKYLKSDLNIDDSYLEQYVKMELKKTEQYLLAMKRLFHNPVTIYLPFQPSYAAIVNLCHELEKVLQQLPSQNENHLCQADISFLPHISFRQESLNNKYISIKDATPDQMKVLRKQALNSQTYQTFVFWNLLYQFDKQIEELKGINHDVANGLRVLYEELKRTLRKDEASNYHFMIINHFLELTQELMVTKLSQDKLEASFKEIDKKLQQQSLPENLKKAIKKLKKLMLGNMVTGFVKKAANFLLNDKNSKKTLQVTPVTTSKTENQPS